MALINACDVGEFDGVEKVGLRAENITVSKKGKGRLACTVTECEFLGSETLIGLNYTGSSGLCVLKPGLSMMPEGEEVDINFNDENLHIFDDAGHRLVKR